MVFGQIEKERLQLNEITVWSGKYNPEADRQEAYKLIPEIRRLLGDGGEQEVRIVLDGRSFRVVRHGAGFYNVAPAK